MYLATVVIATSVAAAAAESSSTSPLEAASWLIGTWEAEYELPSGIPELGEGGEKIKDVVRWNWSLDKKFIVFRFRSEIEGQPTLTGLEVNGVDPTTGDVTAWLFNSTGAQGRGEWTREGNSFILSWTATQPDKTVFKGTSYIRQDGEEKYTWGMRNVTRDGKSIPDWGPVTYRRRND